MSGNRIWIEPASKLTPELQGAILRDKPALLDMLDPREPAPLCRVWDPHVRPHRPQTLAVPLLLPACPGADGRDAFPGDVVTPEEFVVCRLEVEHPGGGHLRRERWPEHFTLSRKWPESAYAEPAGLWLLASALPSLREALGALEKG